LWKVVVREKHFSTNDFVSFSQLSETRNWKILVVGHPIENQSSPPQAINQSRMGATVDEIRRRGFNINSVKIINALLLSLKNKSLHPVYGLLDLNFSFSVRTVTWFRPAYFNTATQWFQFGDDLYNNFLLVGFGNKDIIMVRVVFPLQFSNSLMLITTFAQRSSAATSGCV
jgi:hypothetical protein